MSGALAWLINAAVTLYFFALIGRVFLPLVGADPYNPITQFIYRITEPALAPLRRWTVRGRYDFSPLVVMVALMILERILIGLVYAIF